MKSDLELVWAVKQGNSNAFSELVLRHQKGLFRLLWRVTRDQTMAEDVVQETFIKAYQKIQLFEERSSFKSWLFRIGINTATNSLRSRKSDTYNIDDVHISTAATGERDLVYRDLQILVAKELEKLPDRQKTALMLRIFEDLSFQEIAVIMECPYDTAKANYRHGLLKVKASLEKQDWVKSLKELEDESVIRLKEILSEADS
ncbi:MAG: RNA polymerase sigma factor [Bdellovibrionales bacterium]